MNSVKEQMLFLFPEINSKKTFGSSRYFIRNYGLEKFKNDMIIDGYINNDLLTTGKTPFNALARISSGVMPQENPELMSIENSFLKDSFKLDFMIACNLKSRDKYWDSKDPEVYKTASMSKNHRFLLIKDLSWKLFNVLIIGLNKEDIIESLNLMNRMKEVSINFAKTNGWSNNIGLYFHVYPLNSVHSLHLHIVDMGVLGESFYNSYYKNLSLDIVIEVLSEELNNYNLI